jgi:hypothetical protein
MSPVVASIIGVSAFGLFLLALRIIAFTSSQSLEREAKGEKVPLGKFLASTVMPYAAGLGLLVAALHLLSVIIGEYVGFP